MVTGHVGALKQDIEQLESESKWMGGGSYGFVWDQINDRMAARKREGSMARRIAILKRAASRQIGRKHTRTLTGKALADGTANPAAPASDKGGLALQHHACSAFSYASSTSPWK